ncbi:UNVERIFIED_CONTAM: hypothetical protein K2H54_001715 [Gekko kuhli]
MLKEEEEAWRAETSASYGGVSSLEKVHQKVQSCAYIRGMLYCTQWVAQPEAFPDKGSSAMQSPEATLLSPGL